jgi:hypothetical protein
MKYSPPSSPEAVIDAPPLRPQKHEAGTTSAPLKLARRSADSLDGFFDHIHSGRDTLRSLSYPAFYGERNRNGAAETILGHDEFDPPRDLLNELLGADDAGSADKFSAERGAFLEDYSSTDASAEGAPQPSIPAACLLDEKVVLLPIALIKQFAGEGAAEPSLDLIHNILEGQEIENLDAAHPAVDLGDRVTDIGSDIGPQSASPLSYHDLRKEAELLRPLISRDELKKFFGGKFIEEHLRRKLLAFFRVLQLHNVSKLSDLKGVPKLRGDRRIDRQLLATDLDLKKDYFKGLRDQVNGYRRANGPVPAWMYNIIKSFSLNEGRKPLEGLETHELSLDVTQPTHAAEENADATRVVSDTPVEAVAPKLPYSTVLEEAKELAPFISDERIHEFLKRRGAVEAQRKLLGFIQALDNHGVPNLSDLAGFPGEDQGRVDIKALAADLKLRESYFNTLRFDVNRNERIWGKAPQWMSVLMERFSIGRT